VTTAVRPDHVAGNRSSDTTITAISHRKRAGRASGPMSSGHP
jgi:hypothetical protein